MTALDVPLFDAAEYVERPVLARPVLDLDALDAYAFLYTATEAGNATGIRFMATRDHAQAWCESETSQGVLHGTAWAYFWTSVPNYLRRWAFDDIETFTLDLSDVVDNGEWDDRIAATGCVKLGRPEIARILTAAGVECR